ncbi:MAG TPA: hypothetical protein VIL55_12635 [Naasia sp.]
MADVALSLLLRVLGAPVVAPADLLVLAVVTVAVAAVGALACLVLAVAAAAAGAARRAGVRPRSSRRWAALLLPSADPAGRPRPRAPGLLLPIG